MEVMEESLKDLPLNLIRKSGKRRKNPKNDRNVPVLGGFRLHVKESRWVQKILRCRIENQLCMQDDNQAVEQVVTSERKHLWVIPAMKPIP